MKPAARFQRKMKSLPQRPFRKIAIVGNFLPRQCGIAAFTSDLAESLSENDGALQVDVVAMSDDPLTSYPCRVRLQIPAEDYAAYRPAAEFLNHGDYEVVSVQHEYGIFGGESGEYLLTILRSIRAPIVTTLHTVVDDPSPSMRRVTSELLALSDRVVVMSAQAAGILAAEYGLRPSAVDLIPHGVPDLSQGSIWNIKEDLKITGPMLLTFGLLSPDKGIQYAIEALPAILKEIPEAVYVILGATHPQVRASAGEAYRQSLTELAESLGVSGSIRFVDQFVSQPELVSALSAADVYITPYLNPKQITSGTLAYAVGAGKAVVSTPYLYAQELLANERGSLVPFRDAAALATAVIEQVSGLSDESPAWKNEEHKSDMAWSKVARLYADSFSRAAKQRASGTQQLSSSSAPIFLDIGLPPLSSRGIVAMSDDTGLYQHAFHSIPDRSHGYCVDDNARGLIFTVQLEELGEANEEIFALQKCFLSFVHNSFNPDNGRFRNFMSFDRRWLEPMGSEDSHGRTMWALGVVAGRTASSAMRRAAVDLFHLGRPALAEMGSPQTWAYAALGADEFLTSDPMNAAALALRTEMTGRLMAARFKVRSPGWHWFEDVVSYANGRMSQALIRAGQWQKDHMMLDAGLASLEWLMDHQTAPEGHFRPIGSNGFWRRDHSKAIFDQQPVEAWASLSACISAANATGDLSWMRRAENTFQWFQGKNDLGLPLFDPETGGCCDGLHQDRVNANQGAESCLSYLCALAELKAEQARPAVAKSTTSTL
jgi:glycosyltransferase involved in cell wall biosynthesis